MKLLLPLVAALAALPLAAQQNPSTMPRIATVDPRFQSYNIEMVEVIGGRFWKPYASKAAAAAPTTSATPGGIDPALFEQRTPIDLTDPRLRKLAAALGPAYLRVSGTWANTVYFQDSDAPAPATPPEGFGGVLTRPQWKAVVDFSKAVDAPIVTSFSTTAGTRDKSGTWTPAEAKKFLAYTQSIGGTIAAAEFMNEPTFVTAAGVPPGYDGAAYGRDYAVFQPFFRKAAPHALLLGPGSVGEGIDFVPMKLLPSKDLLTAMGPNAVDVFSYHFYGGISERCALGPAANCRHHPPGRPLRRLAYPNLHRQGLLRRVSATPTPPASPSGSPKPARPPAEATAGPPPSSTPSATSTRWAASPSATCRSSCTTPSPPATTASSTRRPSLPRPSYWAALLWHNTMGTTVLDPGPAPTPTPTVHLYAQCTKNQPGGVTLLALNLSPTDPPNPHPPHRLNPLHLNRPHPPKRNRPTQRTRPRLYPQPGTYPP